MTRFSRFTLPAIACVLGCVLPVMADESPSYPADALESNEIGPFFPRPVLAPPGLAMLPQHEWPAPPPAAPAAPRPLPVPPPVMVKEPEPPRMRAIQTRAGDTLDQILKTHLKPSPRDVPSLRKEVVALNPEGFLHRNPDRLLAGVTLTLPVMLEPLAARVPTELTGDQPAGPAASRASTDAVTALAPPRKQQASKRHHTLRPRRRCCSSARRPRQRPHQHP